MYKPIYDRSTSKNEMADKQRFIPDFSKTTDESDQEDIQIKQRTKRASSTKQPKPSLKRAHSSPSREEPAAAAQTIKYETPTKAKTRAARRENDTFEEETPVPQAPRKVRRTEHYVRIDAVRMNLARKFKEGI